MILLTGASGFVGRAVSIAAIHRGFQIRVALRTQRSTDTLVGVREFSVLVPTLLADTDWSAALIGVDVVVHCAARVHLMRDFSSDPLYEFRKVNVAGTLNLARQAAAAGVRRFLFISSIKVNGEETENGYAYTAEDAPAPKDPYGVSKAEAEFGLRQLVRETGMEVVIIRPPLVYGPSAKGNFANLLAWVERGLPSPLGAVTQNRRSMVGLDNLVDLILTCVTHPKAANQTFLVSDGEDLSTTELLQKMGKAMNRPARLLPVPAGLLRFAASLLGKKAVAQRLLGSLKVDISKTCELLDWKPQLSVDEGLRKTVEQRV